MTTGWNKYRQTLKKTVMYLQSRTLRLSDRSSGLYFLASIMFDKSPFQVQGPMPTRKTVQWNGTLCHHSYYTAAVVMQTDPFTVIGAGLRRIRAGIISLIPISVLHYTRDHRRVVNNTGIYRLTPHWLLGDTLPSWYSTIRGSDACILIKERGSLQSQSRNICWITEQQLNLLKISNM